MSAQPYPDTTAPNTRDWLHSMGVTDAAIAEFGIVPIEQTSIPFRNSYAATAVAYPCMTTSPQLEIAHRVRQKTEPNDPANQYCKRHIKDVSPSASSMKGELLLYSWGAGKLSAAIKANNGILNLFESPKNCWVHFSMTGENNVSAIFGTGNASKLPTDTLLKMGVKRINYFPDNDNAGYAAAYKIAKVCDDAGIESGIFWLADVAKDRDGFDMADYAKDLDFDADQYRVAFDALPEMPADELGLYAPPPAAPNRAPGESYDDSLWDKYVETVIQHLVRRDGNYDSWKQDVTRLGECFCDAGHKHADSKNGRISERSGHKVFLCTGQGAIDWREIGGNIGVTWDAFKGDHNLRKQQDKMLDDAGLTRLFPQTEQPTPAKPEKAPAAKQEAGAMPSNVIPAPMTPQKPENANLAPSSANPAPVREPLKIAASVDMPEPPPLKNDTSVEFASAILYDQALEEHLVGNILRVPTWYKRLSPKAAHFGYRPASLAVMAMNKLEEDGVDITLSGVSAKLRTMNFMEQVGEDWLKRVHSKAHNDQETQALFDTVEVYALRRHARDYGKAVIAHADNIRITRDGLIGRIQNGFNDLVGGTIKRDASVSDLVTKITEYREKQIFYPDRVKGIETPWARLTNILGGLQKGKYTVIGAFTGNGKSTLMYNLGAHALTKTLKPNGEPPRILFVTLEMTDEEVTEAFMDYVQTMPVPMPEYVESLTPEQQQEQLLWTDVLNRGKALGNYSRHLHISNVNTPSKLRAKIEEIRMEYGDIDLIFLDYIQLENPDHPSGNKTIDIESISREFKLIAIEYKLHFITATQYPKDATGRDLEDASKWASGIIQDADIVLQIYSETGKSTEGRFVEVWNDVEFRVTKIRGGMPAICDMTFNRPAKIFTERY